MKRMKFVLISIHCWCPVRVNMSFAKKASLFLKTSDVFINITVRSEVKLKKYNCVYWARDNFGRSADGRYWTTGRGSPTVGEVHGGSFTSVDFFVFINGITIIVSTQSLNSALPDWSQENIHTGTYTERETKIQFKNVLKLVEHSCVHLTLWLKIRIWRRISFLGGRGGGLTSVPQNGDVFTGSVDWCPEALFGDDDVAQFVDIPCRVYVLFSADQIDFLTFDGDLDGFRARHVRTTTLDVLRDDLETLVLGSGQNVGADALKGERDSIECRVVRVSGGSADGCSKDTLKGCIGLIGLHVNIKSSFKVECYTSMECYTS